METVLLKIELTIKTVVDNLIDLLFAPIWCIYNIVNQSVEIWSQLETVEEEDEEEEPEEPEQLTIVTQYPSANEGKFAEECDYPIGHKRIGFRQYDSKE